MAATGGEEWLAARRREGSKGLYLLVCPTCEAHWVCLVRWYSAEGRYRVVTREDAYCAGCRGQGETVRGDRVRMSDFEGWSPGDLEYVLGG